MKNYIVRAVISFNDLEEKVYRKQNEEFKCTEERYKVLKEHNVAELISIDKEKEDKPITNNKIKVVNTKTRKSE